MVNTTENDRILPPACNWHRTRAIRGWPKDWPVTESRPIAGGMVLKYAAYNNVLFDYMGSANLQTVLLLVPQFAREYGLVDKVNFARGLAQSFAVVYPQLQDLDFTVQAARMEVPMYFLVGRRDINAVAALVEDYYNLLQAPYKELIWLDSGHGADTADILDVMVNRALVKSPPAES